jgi:septal ring factor EnvC (AmiA/AmiB activator)
VFQINERNKNKECQKHLVNDNKQSQKEAQATQDKTMAMIKEYQTILDRVKFERDELEKVNTELINKDNERVKELTALTKLMHEDISKYTNAIAKYSQIEKKLDAILKIEKELANTPSKVKSGTTEKVNDIIKEVK